MFYDAIVNSSEIAEQAECLLRDLVNIRHGMRSEVRDLLRAASICGDYHTLTYQTEKPEMVPLGNAK